MSENLVMATAAIIGIFMTIQVGLAAQVSVVPSYQEVMAGQNFTVNISIDPESSEVFGAQYELHFNNSLLIATSQDKGPFFGSDSTVLKNEINNTLGWLKYGETRTKTPGMTEPGVLTTITFHAIEDVDGISILNFTVVKLSDPYVNPIPANVSNGTVRIGEIQPQSPFKVYGYIFYENGSKCNDSCVNITNLNTGEEWRTETAAKSNYYQLVLSYGTDINASETLRFEVTGPDGKQSNITSYTVTHDDIANGGLFAFNIFLESRPGVFDTGAPANPYPSIMGVHNGTLIPDQRIEANRIYIYSCAGTGGHTEYVRIWGNGVDAHANWSGYAGDWHNLSFNTSFTLEPGKEYNYTIITGSYPQIIHHSGEFTATGGKITCYEFRDVNGKKYDGWIPAFKLWKEEK